MDTGFHHEQALSTALNRHAISFQTSAIDTTTEMLMMGDYYRMSNNTPDMMFSGNSGMLKSSSRYPKVGNFSGSSLSDSALPALKHNAGLAVEWSIEEQYKLEEGISKYGDEPSIMRYIKIAATLRDKIVRDVALRCRWVTVRVIIVKLADRLHNMRTLSHMPSHKQVESNLVKYQCIFIIRGSHCFHAFSPFIVQHCNGDTTGFCSSCKAPGNVPN